LFKIAHVVGGDWPKLINDAALSILGGNSPVEKSRSIELLIDIRLIFAKSNFMDTDSQGRGRITSKDLVEELVARSDRPWGEYNKGRAITQNQVGRLLKDFSIYTQDIWRRDDEGKEKVLKGYYAYQLRDAFERYIPQDPVPGESEPLGREVAYKNNNLGPKDQPLGGGDLAVAKSDLSTGKDRPPSGLAVRNSETRAAGTVSPNEGDGFNLGMAPEDSDVPDFTDAGGFDWADGVQRDDGVRYLDGNGKLQHAAGDEDAWLKIKADHDEKRKGRAT
jgi:hypothetical protein